MSQMLKKEPEKAEPKSALPDPAIPETSSIAAIEYLTIQGGGMKGVGYGGALEALEKAGVVAQLKEVAGSSAGGIVALLVALGYTAEEVKKEMRALDFRNFQDKAEPGWVEATRLKDLARAIAEFNGSVSDKIALLKKLPVLGPVAHQAASPYLGQIDNIAHVAKTSHQILGKVEQVEDWVGFALGSELGVWKGEALSYWLNSLVVRKTGKPNLTFQELAQLAEAQGSPFKKLVLTGSNLTEETLEYYSATTSPDMPIALAARISASFPGAYQPVRVQEGAKTHIKVDGGLLQNLPDIFNHPPYWSPNGSLAQKSNPRAFALVFKNDSTSSPRISKGLDLVKALYNAKMSDQSFIQKYGDRVALIDTQGMSTLEFEASLAKKLAIEKSGAAAVNEAFHRILSLEANDILPLSALDLETLVQWEFAFQQKLKEGSLSPELKKKLVYIDEELQHRSIEKTQLKNLKQEAKARYLKKQKFLNPRSLTDQELKNACLEKGQELKRIQKALYEKVRMLKLARTALKIRKKELLERYEESDLTSFKGELFSLSALQDLIYQNKEKEVLEKNKFKKQALNERLQELKAQKNSEFKKIIQSYQTQNKEEMLDFFEGLREDSLALSFKIPTRSEELDTHCNRDMEACTNWIRQARREAYAIKKQNRYFKEQQKIFSERADQASVYQNLIALRSEMEKSLYQKTTFLTKLNQFLIKKLPQFEKAITPVLKAVSFMSFVCWLPLAIPAVGIAKAVLKLNPSAETVKTAEDLIQFFRKPDFNLHHKLQNMSQVTHHFIQKMNDPSVAQDKSERNYLKRLFAYYFKNSQLKMEEVLNKTALETLPQYRLRVKAAEEQIENTLTPLLRPASVPPNTSKEFLKAQQLYSLRAQILHDVEDKLKKSIPLSSQEVRHYMISAKEMSHPILPLFKKHYKEPYLKIKNELKEKFPIRRIAALQPLKNPLKILKPLLKKGKSGPTNSF